MLDDVLLAVLLSPTRAHHSRAVTGQVLRGVLGPQAPVPAAERPLAVLCFTDEVGRMCEIVSVRLEESGECESRFEDVHSPISLVLGSHWPLRAMRSCLAIS